MSTSITSRTVRVDAGKTAAISFANTVFPITYAIRVPSGSTQTRKFSCARRPGNRYVSPPQRATGTETIVSQEMSPFSWLSVNAAGGPVFVDLTGNRIDENIVITSDDAIASATPDAISLAVGESRTYQVPELVTGESTAADVTATSADGTKVGVEVDLDTGAVTVSGVAATTAIAVTITVTTPAEATASVQLMVTVTA